MYNHFQLFSTESEPLWQRLNDMQQHMGELYFPACPLAFSWGNMANSSQLGVSGKLMCHWNARALNCILRPVGLLFCCGDYGGMCWHGGAKRLKLSGMLSWHMECGWLGETPRSVASSAKIRNEPLVQDTEIFVGCLLPQNNLACPDWYSFSLTYSAKWWPFYQLAKILSLIWELFVWALSSSLSGLSLGILLSFSHIWIQFRFLGVGQIKRLVQK